MNTDTKMSRRRLLAQAPIVAIAAVPTVAIAFPDVPDIAALMQGRPDWQIRGIVSMVDMLPQDPDETRKVLTAICESIKVSMRARDADAELLALKPRFDEIFDTWCWRVEAARQDREDLDAELFRRTGLTREQRSKLNGSEREAFRPVRHEIIAAYRTSHPRRLTETDDEGKAWCMKLYEMINEVLSYRPVTREGLAMQCRAMIMDNFSDWWDWRTPSFVASIVLYLNMELPDFVMDDLFAAIENEGEEEAAS